MSSLQIDNHIFPFLWIHGEDENTYRHMVQVIDEANIKGFCIEARPHKHFCEEEWWRDLDIILDEAEKRGMKVWILDDKHFPTGFANGQMLDKPAELRRQSLYIRRYKIKNKLKLNIKKDCRPKLIKNNDKAFLVLLFNVLVHNFKRQNRFKDDRLVSAVACRLDGSQECIDITDCVNENLLDWKAPEGEWEIKVCMLSRNQGAHRSYINMMDEASCRIQIDAVYEPHYAHYKDKFGKVIAGFFSDEPELGNNSMYQMYNTLGTDQDLPWSRELEEMLAEKLGEEWNTKMSLLWDGNADDAEVARIRYIYMDCVTKLVSKDFSNQIGDWCRAHGVEYIGHIIEDNNQHARTGTSLGHYFRGLQGQSMAGIDVITKQIMPGCEDQNIKSAIGYMDDREFYHYAMAKLGSSLGALNPNMHGRTMCEIFGNYGWSEGVRLEKYLLDHCMVRGINFFVPHAFTCSKYPERDCPPHFYAQGNNPQYRHFGKLMLYANRVTNLITGGKIKAPVAILYHGEAEWTGKCMLMQKPARVCLDNQVDFYFVPSDAFSDCEFYNTKITNELIIQDNVFLMLLIPYAQFITPETAQAVLKLCQKGGRAFFLQAYPDALTNADKLPEDIYKVPCIQLEDLADIICQYKTVTLYPENSRVRAMHYMGKEELIYLFNESTEIYKGLVELNCTKEFCAYNAWDDTYEEIQTVDGKVLIELYPSQSLILLEKNSRDIVAPLTFRGDKVRLNNFLQSVCRSIDYPQFGKAKKIDKLESYALTDKKFSGMIRYETTIHAGKSFTGIEITDAYEGVEVFVNGKTAGIQVIPPFRYNLTELCKEGENTLIIEVATTLEREQSKAKNPEPTGITGDVYLYAD